MRASGHVVDDTPKKYGGKQQIALFDGPTIPLHYRNGLLHMKTSCPTENELKTLPVFDLTLDTPWNPLNEWDDDDDGIAPADIRTRDVNAFATRFIMISDDAELRDDVINEAAVEFNDTYSSWTARLNKLATLPKQINWDKLVPCFAWKPQQVIEKTLENTTQYYRTTSDRLPMRQYFKSRTPALRVPRLHETFSVDWIDSSVPSIYGGQVGAHIFYGRKSNSLYCYGGHGPSDFPDHLTQFIVDKGAPTMLMSDNATAETSHKVADIERKYAIKHHTSETRKQNQNPVERPIQNVKRDAVKLLDRTGAPDHCWLYALMLLCMLPKLLLPLPPPPIDP